MTKMIRITKDGQVKALEGVETECLVVQGDLLAPLQCNAIEICQTISNVFMSQYADYFVLYSSNNLAVF